MPIVVSFFGRVTENKFIREGAYVGTVFLEGYFLDHGGYYVQLGIFTIGLNDRQS